jgi:hypothetical protein
LTEKLQSASLAKLCFEYPVGRESACGEWFSRPSIHWFDESEFMTRLQVPPRPPEKTTCFYTSFFQLNPPLRVGEIVFDDEIPFGDEIRLDGG